MTAFVFRLKASRPTFALDMSDEEREVMGRHAAHWQPYVDSGQMVVFGPILDSAGSWGLGVVEADDEEGASLCSTRPCGDQQNGRDGDRKDARWRRALSVQATSLTLPATVGTTVAQGRFLNPATAQEPIAVLGAAAAARMGIDRIWTGERIWVGRQWFYLAGVLNPAVLAPEIDSAVLIGYPAAEKYLGFDGHPSQIYVRATTDRVNVVHDLLGPTANPENPTQVTVSQPSNALVAQADTKGALNSLFLGLGLISLLVGAIGVGNVMLISVLERRSEIGLRRALGATKGNIRIQFLSEAIILALVGGAAGVALGATATAFYAHTQHWTVVIPTLAWAGGLASTLLIGATAGLLPALRAARMSPTQALWNM
jgi:putative ABC transport system permease protein